MSSVRDAKPLLLCLQLLSLWKRICQMFRKLVERFKCLCVKATCQAMNTLNFCGFLFNARQTNIVFLFKHLPYDQADYVVDIIAKPVSMLSACCCCNSHICVTVVSLCLNHLPAARHVCITAVWLLLQQSYLCYSCLPGM